MSPSVHVTYETTDKHMVETWDTACGLAVREALDGANRVILVDTNGLRYDVWAEPVEETS